MTWLRIELEKLKTNYGFLNIEVVDHDLILCWFWYFNDVENGLNLFWMLQCGLLKVYLLWLYVGMMKMLEIWLNYMILYF